MIELTQYKEAGNYGFTVSGTRREIYYLNKWLAYYEYADKMHFKPRAAKDDDEFTIVFARVLFDKDVPGIPREELAGMFKLTFAQWELVLPIMPSEENSTSEVMDRINKIGDVAMAAIEGGQEWNDDLYKTVINVVDDEPPQRYDLISGIKADLNKDNAE